MAGSAAPAQNPPAEVDNPHYKQAQQDLDNNNPSGAAEEYEAALAADPKLAGAHYELGVLYAEKLSQPIGAIYHLDQFLKLAPNSDHAAAAREMVTTESQAFAASLPGSSSSSAMAKLQLENMALKKQVADAGRTIGQLQAQLAQGGAHPAAIGVADPATGNPSPPVSVPPSTGAPVAGNVALPLDATNAASASAPIDTTGARSYTVVKGDKLWTIAHKLYPGHTKEGVEKIQEANKDSLGTKPLKIGQVLIIPQL
jgi:tetratricopeptide (TPR) repeat protein